MSDQDTSTESRAEGAVAIPIEWYVPDTIVSRYATNLTVQRTDNEVIISFFELPPPLIIGAPAEVESQVQKLKSLRATCVARIIVAHGRMPDFVEVLQRVVQTDAEPPLEEA